MAAAATANNGVCHFFRLSAELRNHIYRDVLVEDDYVPIDTRGFPGAYTDRFAQPGFLQTCRQIRSEANSIYYLENVFLFDLHRADARKLIAFCGQAGSYWHGTAILRVWANMGRDDWGNLFEWLRAFHEDRATWCSCEDDLGSGGCIPARLFDLVDMMDPLSKMPWWQVERVLSIAKDMVESAARCPWL